jgi:23S rRNA (adenine2503-C2)-methyltransferase
MRNNLEGQYRDGDGTEKFVFRNEKGVMEISWLRAREGANVFCLPSHYFCSLGCTFCYLTKEGDKRDMSPIKMDDLMDVYNQTQEFVEKKDNVLLSFMGVGEAFMNPELLVNVYNALRVETPEERSLNVALASMMPTNRFDYFTEASLKHKMPLKIHFSMHSPLDEKRRVMIPNSRMSVEEVLFEMNKFRAITLTDDRIQEAFVKYHNVLDNTEIHYTLIKGVNDSPQELEELIRLGQEYGIQLKLLKFAPVNGMEASSEEWTERLNLEYGAPVSCYAPPGNSIGSACGQFTMPFYVDVDDTEKAKFEEWKKKYAVV